MIYNIHKSIKYHIYIYLITYPVELSSRGGDEYLSIFLHFTLSFLARIYSQGLKLIQPCMLSEDFIGYHC